MSEPEPLPERLNDLVDDYLNGLLDESQVGELEGLLRESAEARRYFVRYARMHTDLHVEMRARHAGECARNRIERLAPANPDPAATGRAAFLTRLLWRCRWAAAVAAALLLALGAAWSLAGWRGADPGTPGPAIAWLVNAQNCTWSDDVEPAGNMGPGSVLKVERGLAEIRFGCGARVVLEGPARLELLSDKSARLLRGKLTARVPGPATGFEVLSPQGKVIDLGTEFGIAVSDKGATDVYVFEGKVEALSTTAGADAVSVTQNQAARIADGKVVLHEAAPRAGQFVRSIVPPPVLRPRTRRLTFDRDAGSGVRDADGRGSGLTHRLPGTGGRLPERDPNLRLDTAKGLLEMTTTKTDINNQYRLWEGEYLGVRLADLGFTGGEDFEVRVTVTNMPALDAYCQFGLYAGTDSKRNIRGGLISSRWREPGRNTQFLVNNHGGGDSDLYRVGLLSPGADLRLTLKRTAGKYSLTVENLTDGSTGALTIRHPQFLDGAGELHVGLFGANAQSDARKTLRFRDFQVTVWTAAAPAVAP